MGDVFARARRAGTNGFTLRRPPPDHLRLIEGGKSPAKVSAGGKFAVKTSTVFCRLLDGPRAARKPGRTDHPAARNDAAQGTLRPYWPPPSRTRHEWFSFLSAWE